MIILITLVFAGACSLVSPPPHDEATQTIVPPADIADQRGRFREIFCAVLDEHGPDLPDYRDCEDALVQIGSEPAGTGAKVDLGASRRHLVAVLVPGFGWDCVAEWLDLKGTAVAHLRRFGYDMVLVKVDGLSSTTTNARKIRDAITAMPAPEGAPRLVLIGYSKGAPDILEAVVSFPEIRDRIAAVVSAAGAIRGSPLADDMEQSELNLLKRWPGAQCSANDGGAVASLRPTIRDAWLAEHPLPGNLRFYSLVTCPSPDRISSVLRPAYKKLRRIDPCNDGMVLSRDQFVPGSTLVGFVNADHWALAVPIARSHPKLGSVLVDHNDFPREALVEALLRFVEEDLAR